MWQERQTGLLANEIEAILSPVAEADKASFYHLIKESLTKTRRRPVASPAAYKPWPLLPLVVCEAICGRYEHALPAAASLELFKAAAEVLDDTEDSDSIESIPSRYGYPAAINAATTLLVLAEKAITRLEIKGVEPSLVIRVIDVINSLCTTACAGQHLDLSPTSGKAVSEDTYLKIISMKSAPQVECACHIGALLATPNQVLVDAFAAFGHNLGMASQIANDIQGITDGRDIINHRITLPVIYALAHPDENTHHEIELSLSEKSKSISDVSQIKDLLFNSGAIHYTTIKMEFYKQQAIDILSKMEIPEANVEKLKLFLA